MNNQQRPLSPIPNPESLAPSPYKKGISLIAVLMFMLAATTAGMVVYRLINSENFASGSRLKHTEAYQAAESGLEATQAWLSNMGADVGALVTEYFEQTTPKPIHLTGENNILGMVSLNEDKQNFKVYLIDIDKSQANNATTPALKLKFISVGKARDDSQVKLSGIFEVSGLYKANILTFDPNISSSSSQSSNSTTNNCGDFNWAYFGGGKINFSGDKTFESMGVNGSWKGNPPNILGDFVVSGDLEASANKITVGGTTCVGGNYDPNNGADVKDIYIGSSTNFIGNYENVYAEGSMKLGTAFPININGNLTINGVLNFNINAGASVQSLPVKGNLVIGNTNTGAYVNANELSQGAFTVCGSVHTNNASAIRNNNETGGNRIRFNGGINSSDNCDSNPEAVLVFRDAALINNSKYQITDGGYFTSPIAGNSFETGTYNKPSYTNTVKDYCETKWVRKEPSCSGNSIVIEDPIASTLNDIETFYNAMGDNKPICADNVLPTMNNGVWIDNLNACYQANKNSPDKLYGGYLVVKWAEVDNNYFQNAGPQPNQGGVDATRALDGKFIFIYTARHQFLKLAPTKSDAKVMMFLKDGVSKELRSAGCNNNLNEYNYFIYSLDNITETNGWDDKCPLKGAIFFPQDLCKGLDNANNGFKAEINQDLYQDLFNSGILCRREKDPITGENINVGNCTQDEVDKTKSGDASLCNPSQFNSSSSGNLPANYGYEPDKHWLAVSSRLKVSLKAKTLSREKVEEATSYEPKSSVLIVPRIVRLTTDAFANMSENENYPLEKFYTPMFLNTPPNQTKTISRPTTCKQMGNETIEMPTSGILPDNVAYKCTFADQETYSDFYVVVKGKSGDSKVMFEKANYMIDIGSDDCAKVEVRASNALVLENPIVVPVMASVNGGSWTITLNDLANNCSGSSFNMTITTSSNWELTCTKDYTGGKLASFSVCSDDQGDVNVRFEFKEDEIEGIISGIPRTSTVSAGELINIERNGCSTSPGQYYCDYVPCGLKDAFNWINVTCTEGIANTLDRNNRWSCRDEQMQTASYSIVQPLPDGCEISSNFNLNGNINLEGIGTGAGVMQYPFFADLKWKEYTVTVRGGTLNWITYNSDLAHYVLQGELSGTVADGGTFKVYHGAEYYLSSDVKKDVSCDASLNCNSNYLNPSPSEPIRITPTNSGTITLSDRTSPTFTCSQETIQKRAGEDFNLNEEKPVYVKEGYPCEERSVEYTLNTLSGADLPNSEPNWLVPDNIVNLESMGYYSINAVLTCDGLSSAPVACGTLEVVSAKAPTISCNFSDMGYVVGDKPEIGITVTHGDLIKCNKTPTLEGYNVTSGAYNAQMALYRAAKEEPLASSETGIYTVAVSLLCDDNSTTITGSCSEEVAPAAELPSCACATACGTVGCEGLVTTGFYHNGMASNEPKCIFFRNAEGINLTGGNGGAIKVNNKDNTGISCQLGGTACGVELNSKIGTILDNGYYIYIPGNTSIWYSLNLTATSPENCKMADVQPTVSCNWGDQTIYSGASITFPATKNPNGTWTNNNNIVTCSDGSTPNITDMNPTNTSSFLDPSTIQSGTYKVKVDKCGTQTPTNAGEDVICGNLTIVQVSSSSGGGQSSSSAASRALTCSWPSPMPKENGRINTSEVVKCNNEYVNGDDISWVATNNFPNWDRIAQGSYTNIKATVNNGACAGETVSCGSFNVTPSGGIAITCIIQASSKPYCTNYDASGNIPVPTVLCSDGSSPQSVNFQDGSSPQNPNWVWSSKQQGGYRNSGTYDIIIIQNTQCGSGNFSNIYCDGSIEVVTNNGAGNCIE